MYIDVFKGGKIMAGINLNTLDNVRMTTDTLPPFHPTPLGKIYDLKPLRTVEHIPLSFFMFFIVVFKPRNIQDSELKPWRREVEYFQQKDVPPWFYYPSLISLFHFNETMLIPPTRKNPGNLQRN